MKKILIVFACLSLCFSFLSSLSLADEYVNGYYRSNGTYVNGYYRSDPDDTVTNNYSYEGNINPYTGKIGTDRYIHSPSSAYYQGDDSAGSASFSEDNSNNDINSDNTDNSSDSSCQSDSNNSDE